MVTTITEFKLSEPITLEEAKQLFLSTSLKYEDVSGLIEKCYMLSGDRYSFGGVYLWISRDRSEEIFTEKWIKHMSEKYNAKVSVTYFETPVVVNDNVIEKIYTD